MSASSARSLAPLAGACAFAGLAFGAAFTLRTVLAPVLVAAVAAAVCAAATSLRRRLPLAASLLVSTAAFLVSWWLLIGHQAGGPLSAAVWTAARDGLAGGWGLLLDTAPPAPADPGLLLLPMALTWAASATATLAATRTRARVLALLFPIVLFAVATAMSTPGRPSARPLGAAVAICAALFVQARHAELDRDGKPAVRRSLRSGRAAVSGLSIVLVAASLALVVGPKLPGLADRAPRDPRTARPVRAVTDVSPLTALTAWRSGPDQVLFEAEAPAPTRWPLAVLDQFDGDSWTSSGRFLRAQTGEVGRGHPASLRVTLRDLDGVFLPSALGLTRVSGPNLAINAPLHTVITPGGARAPLTYNIYASAPRRLETRELVALRPANDAQARASLALPGRTDDLRQLARSITRTTAAPYAKAERIAQYLRASYGFDPAAPGGHTIGDIDDFLIHSHRGTSEQFAATFAVLARAAGLPTRIVVGFTAGSRAEGTDTYEVHAHDAVAWDEVDFAGLGWLPFYPTPDTTKVIDDYSLLGAAAPQGQPTTPPPPVTHVHGPPPTTQHTAARPHRHPQADLLRCLLGLIALLMLVYLTAVLVVPRRRRRRRRVVRSPQLRVLGAWLDGLEALDAAGIRVPPSATADEVTVLGGDAVHGSLAPLARLAVASLYAAHITTADEANAAWAYRDRLAAELRHQRGPARHLASVLSPHRLRSSATPRRQARRRMAAQEPQIQESR